MVTWEHKFAQANGIRMHYVTAGKGPLLLLLHGFPEFWYAWRHQIPALAEHFQVVAPDLRGYGETERPAHVEDYRPDILAADIADLVRVLGHEKAHVAGHDWGGAVAWRVALEHPQVVDRLVVMNCPHPYIFAQALRTNIRQMGRSWYIFLFQIPQLPEFIFKIGGKRMLEGLFRKSSIRKDAFTDEDIERYFQALSKPGAFTAALNYYRAARLSTPKKKYRSKKIEAPTLVIWGEKDTALGKELTYNMDPLFSGPLHIDYVPNCSHWVNEEQPELVNKLLLEFLS